VARRRRSVALSDAADVDGRLQRSRDVLLRAFRENREIYGITTGFGGLSNVLIPVEQAEALQENIFWFWKSATGDRLPEDCVRASMLIRLNSLARGHSGVRRELLERLAVFLNRGVTPHVYDLGSIGASGDLQPLAYIGGAVIGHPAGYKVDFAGRVMDARDALRELNLEPLRLQIKEGLALVNGSSVMTGIAAACMHDARSLFRITIGAHALAMQALGVSNEPFAPFIHRAKPHPGQQWAAAAILRLLSGSKLIHDELTGRRERRIGVIQDRYSVRAFPQYTAPIYEGLLHTARQVEIEMNSTSDNPIVDPEGDAVYHCANFYGEHIAVGMDHLRAYIALLAKHLDVQIALVATSEFNGGLPQELIGNSERKVNMGLVSLQVVLNSILPHLCFLGNTFADDYATHAEQFNQNVNSIGFGSANLARQSITLWRRYLAVALLFITQAVDLRTFLSETHYDARKCLSPATAELYSAVRKVVGKAISPTRPYIWNDDEQDLQQHVAAVTKDLAEEGEIVQVIHRVVPS
jgi:phenylalanine ammonia-lyase